MTHVGFLDASSRVLTVRQMGYFGNGLSWKSFGLCEAQSSPQKLPIYTAGFKPNYSLQLYLASQNFTGVRYIGLYLEKTLGPEGQGGSHPMALCRIFSILCWLSFHFGGMAWLICLRHCNFKANYIIKEEKKYLFPFL